MLYVDMEVNGVPLKVRNNNVLTNGQHQLLFNTS